MTERSALLLRYLRQQAELGGGRIFLDSMTAAQALTAARVPPGAAVPHAAGRAEERTGHPGPAPTSAARIMETLIPPAAPSVAAPRGALQGLRETAAGCTRCRLHTTRTTVVFGEGSEHADLVVVGEAPGQEEDRTGRPFVGRAGRLLDLLLMSVGLPRDHVYICNVLKCRPPENRNPLPDEVDPCTTDLVHAQLEQIAPRVLLAVGKFAAQVLAASEESIGRLRGRVYAYRGTPLVVTYHPAYLLRSPQMTRVAWEDFQLARRVLNEARRS